jgi:predicted DsbA family dithiol-disulfide isomerase
MCISYIMHLYRLYLVVGAQPYEVLKQVVKKILEEE